MAGLTTQEKLLKSGKRWFLKKGFKSAPLRSIVSDAGYTFGAFYGYYKTKEDLFYALTDETVKGFGDILYSIRQEMDALPAEQKLYQMVDCYLDRLPELVDFIKAHKDEMTLLLQCSDGTKYENFFDTYMKKSSRQIEGARKLSVKSGKKLSGIDPATFDLLMRGYFDMLSKIVLEEKDKDKICRMMADVALVYKNGLISLFEKKS